jgi:hypothetical protein
VEQAPRDAVFQATQAASQPRTALSAARAALVLLGTPLLLFPFFWAAWVSLVLSLSHRLMAPGTALRLGRPRALQVLGGQLLVGPRAYPLSELENGWIEPWSRGLAVVLRFRHRSVIAAVKDAHEGQALLEAVGVGPEQRVLRVPLGSRAVLSGQGSVFHLLGPVLLGLMTLGPAMAFGAAFEQASRTGRGWSEVLVFGGVLLAVGAIAIGLAWLLVPGEAVVGRDGVALRRLWNRRVFPFHAIKGVVAIEHGVRLDTEQGEISLPTATFFANDENVRNALYRRLLDAMDAWASAEVPAGTPLARRGLSLAAWRDALLVAVKRGGYREESLDPDDLLRLLEDPSASLEQRVGATLALTAAPLEPRVRRRVQGVIEASAHEPTRAALQGALDGLLDDAQLLDALDAEERLRPGTPLLEKTT